MEEEAEPGTERNFARLPLKVPRPDYVARTFTASIKRKVEGKAPSPSERMNALGNLCWMAWMVTAHSYCSESHAGILANATAISLMHACDGRTD